MRYQEYQPPDELSHWVKLFWVFESRPNVPVPETIVADGYPELIIHFGSPFSEEDPDGLCQQQPPAVACGQLTKPLVLHSSFDAGMIGIRFQPSGMSPFIKDSMNSLTDARVSAEELFPNVDQLVEEIMASSNDAQRIAACNRYLLRTIKVDHDNISLRRALDRILQTGGNITVESLATLMGRSRRSLELAFQKAVGTSPKMYCRITRFRNLVDTAKESALFDSWVQIALDSGFFDQSHLIRDFRRFTGQSPTTFLTEQSSFAHSVNQV